MFYKVGGCNYLCTSRLISTTHLPHIYFNYGVPQGFSLGSLLFIMYASELFSALERHLLALQVNGHDTQSYISFTPESGAIQCAAICPHGGEEVIYLLGRNKDLQDFCLSVLKVCDHGLIVFPV